MTPMRHLSVVRRIAPVVLVVVLGVLFRHEIAAAAARLLHLSPIVLLVLPLFWLWNHVAAFGWRNLLAATAPGQAPETATRLSLLRLQAQALNMAVPALVGIGGGALRIGFTRRFGIGQAAAAAILDDLAGTVAGLLFVALALALWPGRLMGVDHRLLAAIFAGGGLVAWLAIVGLAPALAARLRPERALGKALRVLAEKRRSLVPAFAASVGWHLIERVITAGEIYLAMLALGLGGGAGAGIPQALFVHAVSVAVSLLLFFIPGQPGAAEAAIAAACASVGMDPATGLTVALIRRARQLAVIGLGLTSLAITGGRPASAPESST